MPDISGIQINTHALELSLPQAKLERVAAVVARWSQSKVVSKRDLQSLIGLLSHAATVVPPGHMFIRRLIDTVRSGKCPHHQLRLNAECRSDFMWWQPSCPTGTAIHSCRNPDNGAAAQYRQHGSSGSPKDGLSKGPTQSANAPPAVLALFCRKGTDRNGRGSYSRGN